MSGVSKEVSAAFPYEAHFVEVLGSKMHFVDEGEGEVFLLLHGNPTSSYLWRNIIPHLSGLGRVVAPDLIGMGRSDHPEIDYRFVDHARYLDAFIAKLELKNITLVLHDWGSVLGFHHAARNPDNIKAIAFMEAVVDTLNWSDMPRAQQLAFRLFRAPGVGWFLMSVMNVFVKSFLPQMISRSLTDAERAAYAAPFPTVASRKAVRVWPTEVPIGTDPSDVHDIVRRYRRWLEETPIPKLMLHATPGALITPEVAGEVRARFPNLHSIDLGEGLHFVQEDHPHAIGEGIARWYRSIEQSESDSKLLEDEPGSSSSNVHLMNGQQP